VEYERRISSRAWQQTQGNRADIGIGSGDGAKELRETPAEIAYMEFSERSIPAGLDALIAQGVDDIAVVPYFLFDGVHIREDIPRMIEEYKSAHPKITFKMGNPLGADRRLAAILTDRISECL